MSQKIEIVGGADAAIAAAIAAVVSQLTAEEAAVRATPLRSPEKSPWVQAGGLRQTPLVSKQRGDPPDWSQFSVSGGR